MGQQYVGRVPGRIAVGIPDCHPVRELRPRDPSVRLFLRLPSKGVETAHRSQGRNRGWRGRDATSVFEQLRYAARRLMLELYLGMLLPTGPVSRNTPARCERNEEIRLRHQQGETLLSLAGAFGLSENRVWQIVHGRRK